MTDADPERCPECGGCELCRRCERSGWGDGVSEVALLHAAPDLATWARIARTLTDDGVSTTTISMATGILRTTVYARITRLAPRK